MAGAKAVWPPLRFVPLMVGHFSKLTTRRAWRMVDRIILAK